MPMPDGHWISSASIDFHVHAKPSKRMPFSLEGFKWSIGQARRTGLDACARGPSLGRPVVGGSGAHFWWQVGIKATTLPGPHVTISGTSKAFAHQECSVYRMPYGPVAVQVSKVYKRIREAQQARAA